MKIFKKNQIIIYVIALMLMTAGYLNYTTNTKEQSLETAMQIESNDDMKFADIGDATLVNSNDVTTEDTQNSSTTNTEGGFNNSNITNAEGGFNNSNVTNTTEETNNSNLANQVTDTKNETLQTNSKNTNNNEYFVKSKLERDTMYSQMIETYEKVLNSNNSLETQKQSATQEIQKINETKNSIMICENLIKTKGFENNILFVNGQSVSVIIEGEEIKQEEIAQIQNIVSREMKAEIENIHIATK